MSKSSPPPLYMNISREAALNSDAWWYCNRITESSLEGFLPVSKSLLLRMQSQQSGGAMGQVVLNQHFKAAPLSIIRGCVPSSLRAGQCAERLTMTSPSLGVCGRHGWRRKATQRELDFNTLYLLFLSSLCCKNPPHCLFTIKSRLQSDSHPGRHSCVEYNFKFHHSVWSYVLYFFPISSRCHERVCKIVLHWLCTQRGQSVCFAARL